MPWTSPEVAVVPFPVGPVYGSICILPSPYDLDLKSSMCEEERAQKLCFGNTLTSLSVKRFNIFANGVVGSVLL